MYTWVSKEECCSLAERYLSIFKNNIYICNVHIVKRNY
jgi:tmRNA-binding protein